MLCKGDLVLCGEQEENLSDDKRFCWSIQKKRSKGRKDWYARSVSIGDNWSLSTWEFALDESITGGTQYCMKLTNGRKGKDTIRQPMNTMNLGLECAKVLQEDLLVFVLMYFSEGMQKKKK